MRLVLGPGLRKYGDAIRSEPARQRVDCLPQIGLGVSLGGLSAKARPPWGTQ